MTHTCQAVLFRCVDFRLTKEINRWLKSHGLLESCDTVSVAGSSRGILQTKQGREILLQQIADSYKLHHINTVILLHHSGCGAYKLVYNFSKPQAEEKQQLSDMAEIEKIIKKKFSTLKVRKIWAKLLDDKGDKINFIEV